MHLPAAEGRHSCRVERHEGCGGSGTLERLLHRRMDAVLGNSRAVVEDLKSEGCPEDQVHLIYNGVQLPDSHKTRAEARVALDLDDDAFVAVVVA